MVFEQFIQIIDVLSFYLNKVLIVFIEKSVFVEVTGEILIIIHLHILLICSISTLHFLIDISIIDCALWSIYLIQHLNFRNVLSSSIVRILHNNVILSILMVKLFGIHVIVLIIAGILILNMMISLVRMHLILAKLLNVLGTIVMHILWSIVRELFISYSHGLHCISSHLICRCHCLIVLNTLFIF